MRAIFYTQAEINEAFNHWSPKLRDYAAECRRLRPMPNGGSLSAAELEQFRILCGVLKEFRDSPIRMPAPYLNIFHGSPITLLAANEIFGPLADAVVPLLSDEQDKWFNEIFHGADGWFGSCWVTIHDPVPSVFAEGFDTHWPPADGIRYWVLTKARAGGASHEVWKWDGQVAVPAGMVSEEVTEEGFIDNFNHYDLSGAI